ncbi:Probable aminoacyl tRNA synthase complex-interacting multifunctional protein 2 [Gryllus bimaculatus]|nr:Probable aminoacyl tRNA synthase complex-interacting multifunctional protein 2 [Gryllus bimaculatus]
MKTKIWILSLLNDNVSIDKRLTRDLLLMLAIAHNQNQKFQNFSMDLFSIFIGLYLVPEVLSTHEIGGSAEEEVIKTLEQRWELIESQLKMLSLEVKTLKSQGNSSGDSCEIQDEVAPNPKDFQMQHTRTKAVVIAKHLCPPFSLLFMAKQLKTVCRALIIHHAHSSINSVAAIEQITGQNNEYQRNSVDIAYDVVFIWERDSLTTLSVSPLSQVPISGEVNILRYFCREYEKWPGSVSLYEKRSILESTLIDVWLDRIHFGLSHSSGKQINTCIRDIEKHLLKNKWLVGNSPSLADIALWSAVQQCKEFMASPSIKKWVEEFNPEGWFKISSDAIL